MPPKAAKEQSSDADTIRTEFISKLSSAADAMRQYGNFADALARVVAKVPLDDPELVASLQNAIDAIPAPSRKRKLAALTDAEDGVKRRKREKKPKDPNAPKAPPSAYILFQNEIRNAVRAQNPTIQYRDLMGLISQQWNSLAAEKKQPYFDRVSAAKRTHEEDMAKYNASNPNTIPLEGTSKKAKKDDEAATKTEKKTAHKGGKVQPKSAEIVASSDNEGSASEDESSEDEKEAGDDKASDDGTSEDESDQDPTPPPKKAKKADKRK